MKVRHDLNDDIQTQGEISRIRLWILCIFWIILILPLLFFSREYVSNLLGGKCSIACIYECWWKSVCILFFCVSLSCWLFIQKDFFRTFSTFFLFVYYVVLSWTRLKEWKRNINLSALMMKIHDREVKWNEVTSHNKLTK